MATTLDELVVKISADLSGLRQEMAEGQRITSECTSKIEKSIEQMSSKGGKDLTAFGRIAETALGVFSGETLLKGVEKAKDMLTELFKEVLVEGVKGAEESQD